MTVPLGAYIAVSAVLFFTGCAGVLLHPLVVPTGGVGDLHNRGQELLFEDRLRVVQFRVQLGKLVRQRDEFFPRPRPGRLRRVGVRGGPGRGP